MGLMNLLVGCVGSGVAHLDMCAMIMSRYRSKLCLWVVWLHDSDMYKTLS